MIGQQNSYLGSSSAASRAPARRATVPQQTKTAGWQSPWSPAPKNYSMPSAPSLPDPWQSSRPGFQPGPNMAGVPWKSPEAQPRLLGDLGQLFPQNRRIHKGDIPLIEANLNYQQLEQALMDRARGVESLMYAGGQVGQDPSSVLAREMASGMATGEIGPYSPESIAAGRNAIVSQGRMATQGAVRGLESDFARRNIGGAAPAFELAGLEQSGRAATAAQLGDFAMQMAAGQQSARQAGLSSLSQQAMAQDSLRTQLLNAIANAYLQTERAPIDLSGLLEIPSHAGREIGTGQK